MGNGAHGQWGTWAIVYRGMGYRGIGHMGYGAQGYRARGQWGTGV